MPRKPDAPPLTRGVVLRGIVFAAAIALGALAVWLIVTSTTQKRIELGILAGLWGLLLGTFSMLGSRRSGLSAPEPRPADPGADEPPGGTAVQVRSNAEVERMEETLERRAWQARLEQMLRREIQDAMGREVSSLRAEIASLRGELLEKVGGQLRLERIETTRVIGSDLEALQHEVRQLKVAQDAEFSTDMSELARHTLVQHPVTRTVVEPAQVRPVSRHTVEVEADIQPAQRPAEPAVSQQAPPTPQQAPPTPQPEPAPQQAPPTPQPEPAPQQAPPTPQPEPAPEPAPVAAAAAEPVPPPIPEPAPLPQARHSSPADEIRPIGASIAPERGAASVPEPAPEPAPEPPPHSAESPFHQPTIGALDRDDPFASLPRLSPFVDDGPDPAPPPAEADPAGDYRGRRRRREEQDAADEQSRAARHADRSTGRRHRRDDEDEDEDEDDDLLSRLLSREAAR